NSYAVSDRCFHISGGGDADDATAGVAGNNTGTACHVIGINDQTAGITEVVDGYAGVASSFHIPGRSDAGGTSAIVPGENAGVATCNGASGIDRDRAWRSAV